MINLYNDMLASIPEAVRKGKTTPYTSMNGNMYSFVSKEGEIALRFGKEDLEKFVKEYNTKDCIQYGAVMRGYAEIPESVYSNKTELERYFRLSFENATTLKPKPTKRPKKSSK